MTAADASAVTTAGTMLRAMQALPQGTPDSIARGRRVLILAPHADDESLGCGGLIHLLSAQGNPPYVLILTDGTGSHPNSASYPAPRLKAVREAEARAAVALLGLPAGCIGFAGLRDTAAPTAGPAFDDAVAALCALCRAQGIGTILAPWQHDPHCDHEAAHLMAAAAAQRLGLRHWAYPVWGWTLPPDRPLPGPLPSGVRLDIQDAMPVKAQAILAHQSQYGGLITDDPAGFSLPRHLLAVFEQPFETYLQVQPGADRT